jgi:hypothetical protein
MDENSYVTSSAHGASTAAAGLGRLVRERPGRVRWRTKTVLVEHDPFCNPQKTAQVVKFLEQEWIIEEYITPMHFDHRGGGWGPPTSEWREVPTEESDCPREPA